jgi:hypothetical protein
MVEHKDGPMTVLQLSTFVAFMDWLYGVLPEVLRLDRRRAETQQQQQKRARRAQNMPGLWVN